MKSISNYLRFIENKGISLSEINPGSREYGLALKDALDAIDLLESLHIPVLGGDILSNESGKLTYTYENWYSQKQRDESDDEYVKRSSEEAKNYICDVISRKGNEDKYAVLVV